MAHNLLSNINSAYIEAANRLRPKSKKKKVVAYVESYDDIFFWRSVLSDFEDDNTEIEVMLPKPQPRQEDSHDEPVGRRSRTLHDSLCGC